jgi:hypothetical protein
MLSLSGLPPLSKFRLNILFLLFKFCDLAATSSLQHTTKRHHKGGLFPTINVALESCDINISCCNFPLERETRLKNVLANPVIQRQFSSRSSATQWRLYATHVSTVNFASATIAWLRLLLLPLLTSIVNWEQFHLRLTCPQNCTLWIVTQLQCFLSRPMGNTWPLDISPLHATVHSDVLYIKRSWKILKYQLNYDWKTLQYILK